MNIFITGATGLIGRHLCETLLGQGHRVTVWSTRGEGAKASLGPEVETLATSCDHERLAAALDGCDAVINLAGSSVMTRWTDQARQTLRSSRVELTRRLVAAMQSCQRRPKVLLSASAIGVYGDRGDELLTAQSGLGSGFLPELAADWEREALRAESSETRVVVVRIGLVLARIGGVLGPQLQSLRAGLQPRLGRDRRWMSWIHIDDMVGLFLAALENDHWRGVVEGVAPQPVRADDFDRTLALLHGRSRLRPRIPDFVLRGLLGDAVQLVVDSQRVTPERSLALGYRFRFCELESAFRDILDDRGVTVDHAHEIPTDPYLRSRPPRYELRCETRIDRPLAEVVEFFERPENLGVLTPSTLEFRILSDSPVTMATGAIVDYRIGLMGIPMTWRTEISEYQPGAGFTDTQIRGPYRSWFHRHEFVADGDGTIMRDRVLYAPPLGWLGAIAQRSFIARQLRDIFSHRSRVIARRFPARSTLLRPLASPAKDLAHVPA